MKEAGGNRTASFLQEDEDAVPSHLPARMLVIVMMTVKIIVRPRQETGRLLRAAGLSR
ncbi:MAG TPA: hypothetical protein VHC04_20795 [Rhodopila sp.]|jgi:hypothetical protein|nr:hypothetical protein [Rhodopila sp.]